MATTIYYKAECIFDAFFKKIKTKKTPYLYLHVGQSKALDIV